MMSIFFLLSFLILFGNYFWDLRLGGLKGGRYSLFSYSMSIKSRLAMKSGIIFKVDGCLMLFRFTRASGICLLGVRSQVSLPGVCPAALCEDQ